MFVSWFTRRPIVCCQMGEEGQIIEEVSGISGDVLSILIILAGFGNTD